MHIYIHTYIPTHVSNMHFCSLLTSFMAFTHCSSWPVSSSTRLPGTAELSERTSPSTAHLHVRHESHLHVRHESQLHVRHWSHLHVRLWSHLHVRNESQLHVRLWCHLHIRHESHLHVRHLMTHKTFVSLTRKTLIRKTFVSLIRGT